MLPQQKTFAAGDPCSQQLSRAAAQRPNPRDTAKAVLVAVPGTAARVAGGTSRAGRRGLGQGLGQERGLPVAKPNGTAPLFAGVQAGAASADAAEHARSRAPVLGPGSCLCRFTSLAEFLPCFDISQLTWRLQI